MQKSYVISLISVVLIIFFGFLINKQTQFNKQLSNNSIPAEYMKKLEIYDYHLDGALKSSISGEYWEFRSASRASVIKEPKILIYKKPKYLYKVSADHGNILHKQLSDEIDLIKLSSKVSIVQKCLEDNDNHSGFTLNTSYLEFNPKTEIANTEKHVTISKPGLLITGIGMNANLKLNQLELYEKVATTYRNVN